MKNKPKTLKGLTIYTCFGSFEKPKLTINPGTVIPIRLCLGWISITVMKIDIENFLEKLMKDGVNIHRIFNVYRNKAYK